MVILLGKTKCLNYFEVDEKFYIVDLPGYGFSTMSKEEKENINKLTNYFLETNKNIKHVFLLVDIRHLPSKDDRDMYDWLSKSGIGFSIILNKADKLTSAKQQESMQKITKALFTTEELIPFSSESKQNIERVLNEINSIIKYN